VDKQARLAAAMVPPQIPTFAEALKRYVEKEAPAWTSARYTLGWAQAVEDHAEPLLKLRVDAITHQIVAMALKSSWVMAPVTAAKVRSRVEAVLTDATAQGWRSGSNPAALAIIRDLMPKVEKAKIEVRHMAAARWQEIGEITIKLAEVDTVSALAARFAILTAARAEEVRGLTWVELDVTPLRSVVLVDEDGTEYRDTAGAAWVVPAERMKARREHRVPLAPEALAILTTARDLYPSATALDLVFPGRTGKSLMDIGAQRYALSAAGYGHLSMHGMRACFRGWAGEATSYDTNLAEFALAHRVHGATERAYARGTLFQKRRELMDAWVRFCTRPLRHADADNVVTLRTVVAAG
jgi:integrase